MDIFNPKTNVTDLIEQVRVNDPELECVDLQDEEDFDGPSLCSQLRSNKHVKHLFLGDCNLADDTALAIADALKVNQTIQHVGLGCNNFTDLGALALAESLKVNETVEGLIVHGNQFGMKGCKAFVNALEFNSTIKEMSIVSQVWARSSQRSDRYNDYAMQEKVGEITQANRNGSRVDLVTENKARLAAGTACAFCGKKEKLKKCTKCRRVVYCGVECQRIAWKLHKKECAPQE